MSSSTNEREYRARPTSAVSSALIAGLCVAGVVLAWKGDYEVGLTQGLQIVVRFLSPVVLGLAAMFVWEAVKLATGPMYVVSDDGVFDRAHWWQRRRRVPWSEVEDLETTEVPLLYSPRWARRRRMPLVKLHTVDSKMISLPLNELREPAAFVEDLETTWRPSDTA